jgi:transcriptional regulator of acetoin/glycerol metabolism
MHYAVERAGLLAEGEMIDVADLPPEILEKTGRAPAPSAPTAAPSAGARSPTPPTPDGEDGPDVTRVRAALEQAKWRREKAAEILGVSPRTLYRWIKKLGL